MPDPTEMFMFKTNFFTRLFSLFSLELTQSSQTRMLFWREKQYSMLGNSTWT